MNIGIRPPDASSNREVNWGDRFSRCLMLTDAAVVLWATVGALIVRFGAPELDGSIALPQPYLLVSASLATGWWVILHLVGSREPTILGYGTEEYKRVIHASLWLFGLVAIFSYVTQFDTARGYVGVALPSGLIFLLLSRLVVRKFLQLERRTGRSNREVLIIGDRSSAEHLIQSLRSHPMAGYKPAGVYIPGAARTGELYPDSDLPVIGTATHAEQIVRDIEDFGPDAVALSGGSSLSPKTIRAIGWALADMNVRLIMVPALTDIAGPRIHTQPVAGLPLIHVSAPNLEQGQKILKRSFDILGASLLVVLLSPVFLVLALAIRMDSPGAVLFRQVRVGTAGNKFTMYKFRSMIVHAESLLPDLAASNEGNDVLFKLRNDPRVTKFGAVLRRFSLDELPQLFNVLDGSMSLVGPRPPLPSEVERYDTHAHRRLLVRPGMTGLWQISGRSLLSWDDTIRLDLYYVENWSLATDIAILLRTARAVISRHGAY